MEREQLRDVEKRPVDIALEKSQEIEELLNENPDVEIEFTRDMFGEGNFGERIYNAFSSYILPCEIRTSEGKYCEKRGITTVDYDVRGDGEFKIACGEEHAQKIKEGVKKDLDKYGSRPGTFGRNGFGRG